MEICLKRKNHGNDKNTLKPSKMEFHENGTKCRFRHIFVFGRYTVIYIVKPVKTETQGTGIFFLRQGVLRKVFVLECTLATKIVLYSLNLEYEIFLVREGFHYL